MCTCKPIAVSRDFLALMRIASHESYRATIDNYGSMLPANASFFLMPSCEATAWAMNTALSLYEMTGIVNLVEQRGDLSVVPSPAGYEFISSYMCEEIKDGDLKGGSPEMWLRVHVQHSARI